MTKKKQIKEKHPLAAVALTHDRCKVLAQLAANRAYNPVMQELKPSCL